MVSVVIYRISIIHLRNFGQKNNERCAYFLTFSLCPEQVGVFFFDHQKPDLKPYSMSIDPLGNVLF